MFEFMFCSLVTLLPDYLFRRYGQGKRIGHEITLFSVWYELRYGIVSCVFLTILLITTAFFFHPTTSNVTSLFRTVSILPEANGRVAEIYVRTDERVSEGDPILKLDDSVQQATLVAAQRRLDEVLASFATARVNVDIAEGGVDAAQGTYDQAKEEFDVRKALLDQGSAATSPREVERLENDVEAALGALDTAQAQLEAAKTTLEVQLPASQASAEAAVTEAQAQLDKMTLYAGSDGVIKQFLLQEGDVVSPIMRPGGILVPDEVGQGYFEAGFDQLAAQLIKVGMIGEMTCASLPWRIIPMQVVQKTDFIPAGQFRPTDELLDLQDRRRPGTITATLRPLDPEQGAKIPRGSKCIVNLYSDHHEEIESGEVTGLHKTALHVVDALGFLHAIILRSQALQLPIKDLVLTGGH